MRSDRIIPSQPRATSYSSESDDSEPESQGVAAAQTKPVERHDSSGSESDSESESDSSSQSQGGVLKPISVLMSNKRNGSAKKVLENSPSAQKPVKQGQKDEQGAKRARTEASKRERDNVVEEKGPFKKRFKDSSENAIRGAQSVEKSHSKEVSIAEKAGREKHTPVQNGDRKLGRENTSQMTSRDSGKEPSKKPSKQRMKEESDFQLHPINQPENTSERKGSRSDNEVKLDKKVTRNSESETVKEALSPQKPRKTVQTWTPKDEIALSTEVLNLVKSGSEIPTKKVDAFWSILYEQLQDKLEAEFSKEQLCDKVKRMKTRCLAMAEKMKESQKPFKHRNSTDEVLFGIWIQIWGKTESSESEDTEEADEEKDKEEVSKPAAAAAKIASVKEIKVKQDRKDSDAAKGIQPKSTSSETEGSGSEDNDDGAALEGNGTTVVPMELDGKVIHETKADAVSDKSHKSLSDLTVVPKDTGLHIQGSNKSSSPNDIPKVLQDEVRTSLLEMQGNLKQMLEEWLNKAMAFVENAAKTTADKSRLMNGINLAGIGGLSLPPFRNWECMDFQLPEGEQAFQQQWYELHIQELEVCSQRLQLLQRECHLKQEQLKLQLERGK